MVRFLTAASLCVVGGWSSVASSAVPLDATMQQALRKLPEYVDMAVYSLTTHGGLSSSSVSGACRNQVDNLNIGNHLRLNRDQIASLESECISSVEEKMNALSGTDESKSCKLWAYAQGDAWFKAKLGMKHAPFAKKTNEPVTFYGEVTNVSDNSIFVYASIGGAPTNAIIDVSEETVFIDPAKVAIGNNCIGYGVVVGAERVNLVNGRETVISRISASCIE